MNKAIFLDRDGVINIDHGYISSPQDIEIYDDFLDLFNCNNFNNYLKIIVTNQSGIARGLFSIDDYKNVSKYIKSILNENKIFIDKEFYCKHHPDFDKNCNCRKPSPGMINKAIKEFNIDPNKSYLIGDKISDIQAGYKAGIKNLALVIRNDDYIIDDTNIDYLSVKDLGLLKKWIKV